MQRGLYSMRCLYILVQSWSSCLAVPLSFNDNFSIICSFFSLFWYENINISNTSRRGGWTGLGTAKVGCFPLFSSYPTFLPPGHVVPDCQVQHTDLRLLDLEGMQGEGPGQGGGSMPILGI